VFGVPDLDIGCTNVVVALMLVGEKCSTDQACVYR
jgi:hypothetical protein